MGEFMGFVYLLHMRNTILKTRTFSYLVGLDAYFWGVSLHLFSLFVYACSETMAKLIEFQYRLSLRCSHMQ